MIDNIQKPNRNNENSGGSSGNDRQRSHLPHEEDNQYKNMYSSNQIRLSYPDFPSTHTSTPNTPVPSTSINYSAATDTVLSESHDNYDSDSSYHTAPLQNDDSTTAEQNEMYELRLQRVSVIQERMEFTDESELEEPKAVALNSKILKVEERMSLGRNQKKAIPTTSTPNTTSLPQLENSNSGQSANSHQSQNNVPFITQIIPAKPKRDKLQAKVIIVISDDDDDEEAMDTTTPNHSNSNNMENENTHVDTQIDQRSRPNNQEDQDTQPDLTSSSSLFHRRPKRRSSPKEEATYTTKKRTRNTPVRISQTINPKKKVKKAPRFTDPSPADELSIEREAAKKMVIGSHISGKVAIVQMRAQFCDLYEYAKRHELNVYQQANLDVLIRQIISCWGYADDHIPAPLLNRNEFSITLPYAQLPEEYYGDASTIDYDAYRLDSLSLLRAVRYFLNGTTDYANIQIPMHLQLELSELNDQEKVPGIYINENFNINDFEGEEENIDFDDDIDSNQSKSIEEADVHVKMLPGRDTQTRFVSPKESDASNFKQPSTSSASPSDISMLDLLLKSVNDSYVSDSNRKTPSLKTSSNVHENRQLSDPLATMKNHNMPDTPMADYALATPHEPCKFERCDDPYCPYMHTF